MGVRATAVHSARARRCFCLLSMGVQLLERTLKYWLRTVVRTQPQQPSPCVLDYTPDLQHQLLQHRLPAPALGRVANWRIFANEPVLPHQAQDIHDRRQRTHHIAGPKLTTGQALLVHNSLEFRVKLLVRGMVLAQIDNVRQRECCCRHRCQSSQVVFRQQKWLDVLLDGSLNQAKHRAWGVGGVAHAFKFKRLAPHALALAQVSPQRKGIVQKLDGVGPNRHFAMIPYDDDGNLARQGRSLGTYFLLDLLGAQARVGAKQKRQKGQQRCRRQDLFEVALGFTHRALHGGAQSSLQTVAQRAEIGAVASKVVYTLVNATNGFFLSARVVHHESIPVHDHEDTGQDGIVPRFALIAGRHLDEVECIS